MKQIKCMRWAGIAAIVSLAAGFPVPAGAAEKESSDSESAGCIGAGAEATQETEDNPTETGEDPADFDLSSLPLLVHAADPVERIGEGQDPEAFQYSEEYSAWWNSHLEAQQASADLQPSLAAFYEKTMQELLADDGETNAVCSPVNLYFALAMLTECTGGETQGQLLDFLGADSLQNLRKTADAVWNANAQDTPLAEILPANSLWMNQDVAFRDDTLQTLAERYHVSSFAGDLSGQEANRALHTWINENTNHLLEQQADAMQMDADTVLALISTLYYKASWQESFAKEDTTEEVFYGKTDLTVPMMHQELHAMVYSGDGFRALPLSLSAGTMWIFLPNDADGVGQLASNPEVIRLVQNPEAEGISSQFANVRLSLPRFDAASRLSLADSLQKLGVTKIFESQADFTPLIEEPGCFVSQIEHAARVQADEDGVEAAAFTAVKMEGTALIEENIDFTVDRPFLFVLTGDDGSILFTGLVNRPEEA